MTSRRPYAGVNRRSGFRGIGGGGGGGTPWLPSDIADLLGWWRADFVESAGSDVTRMTDLSGNGHHLDAPSGKEPQLTASNATLNSQPTVDFRTASTSYMRPVTATNSDWNSLHDGTGSTLLLVATPRGSSAEFWVATYAINNTPGFAYRWVNTGTGTLSDITGKTGGFIFNENTGASSAPAGTGVVLTRIYEEGRTPEEEMGCTGATLTTASSGSAPDSSDANQLLVFGAQAGGAPSTGYGNFDLAEAMIVGASVSAAEESALTSYLTARYGIAPVWS